MDRVRFENGKDCREIVERDLGKPRSRTARYSTFKCPFHHETKGFSLVVYDDYWRCYGKCTRSGDAISWLREYHNLSFAEACERLDMTTFSPQRRAVPARRREAPAEPPDEKWQQAARRVAAQAMDTLWGKEGKRAWQYLEAQRGLAEGTIIDAGLGYVPGAPGEWREIEGLNIPCGITIPWFADGSLWGIKVRRAAGEIRYQQVSGGNIKGSLYLADTLQRGLPILLTEGEFDALVVRQTGRHLVSAASIGSAGNRQIDPRWYRKFLTAPRILVRMDDDAAGQAAASEILAHFGAGRAVQVPMGKDVNDFYRLTDEDAVLDWLREIASA